MQTPQKFLITFLLFALCSFLSNAQDKFEYDINGLSPKYMVIEIDSMNSNTLYEKSINWIKETFGDPDRVIRTTIEGEKIRFRGFKSSALIIKSMGIQTPIDSYYTVVLSFKNGKYKFEPVSFEWVSQGTRRELLTPGVKDIYKKNGKIRSPYKTWPLDLTHILNQLDASLYNYITKKETDDDW